MEHTQSISPNIDKLLLEASLMYKSANTSNSEEQQSMKMTPKYRFANPVTLEYLKEKVKTVCLSKLERKQIGVLLCRWNGA